MNGGGFVKFQKKAEYDYESNGITEENGYEKWYEWEKLKKPVRYLGIFLVALMFALGRVFKNELAAFGKINVIIAAFAALATLIVIVVPVHELLHLLVMSKGKLDDKCIITAGGGAVSALYNGHISRNRYLVCLVTPCVVLAAVFALAVILSHGVFRLYFIYLLIMSCVSSYTDIYMFFYLLRHIGKDEIIFGIYKKKM